MAAWGISTVLTVLPALFYSGGFGPSFGYAGGGNWCWLRDSEWVTRVIFFYIWLLVAIITVCIFFGLSSRAMKVGQQDRHDAIFAFRND